MPPFARSFILAAAALAAIPAVGQAAEKLSVYVDEATILKLPDRLGTVVIGNPAIADISVQGNGIAVVTGRGFGVTNILMLDAGGRIVKELSVSVRAKTDGVVTVFRGTSRESYSCLPRCEPTLRLGDAPDYHGAVLGGITTHGGPPAPGAAAR